MMEDLYVASGHELHKTWRTYEFIFTPSLSCSIFCILSFVGKGLLRSEGDVRV